MPWAFSPRRGGVARTGMQGAATRIVAMVRQRIALAPNDLLHDPLYRRLWVSMLGRITSTMRWLILIPACPGALIGGRLGQHMGLRASLEFAGIGTGLLTLVAWRSPLLRGIQALPVPDNSDAELALEVMRP